jgi:hypothetical protein
MRLLLEIGLLGGIAAGAIAFGRIGDEPPRQNAPATARALAALTGFSALDIDGEVDVAIAEGKNWQVQVLGPPQDLGAITAVVREGVLYIAARDQKGWPNPRWGDVAVRVTMPELSAIAQRGSGDVTVERLAGPAVRALLVGSGDLDIEAIDAQDATLAVTGSGNLRAAAGQIARASLNMKGSGELDMAATKIGTATVEALGSGDVTLNASGAVRGTLNGSGEINVAGTTDCAISVAGSGDGRCQP